MYFEFIFVAANQKFDDLKSPIQTLSYSLTFSFFKTLLII